jgi:hypothetical protein
MKKIILIMTVIMSSAACQKDKLDNKPTYNESVKAGIFGEKEWQLTSIHTTPALLDINGDGQKESELISTLTESERNKLFVFAPDGKVWEKKQEYAETITAENGNWKPGADGNSITWIQKDGTVLNAKAELFSGHEVRLSYKNEHAEIVYTLTAAR